MLAGDRFEPGADIPAGFADLPITRRDETVGAFPNWYLALAELVMRQPRADAYFLCQDDVLLSEGLRGYLEEIRNMDAPQHSDYAAEVREWVPWIVDSAFYNIVVEGTMGYGHIQAVEDLIDEMAMMNGQAEAYGGNVSAPSASQVMRVAFNTPIGQRHPIYDQNGIRVGMYDPGTGLVYRPVQRGERIVSRPRPYEDVANMIETVGPEFDGTDWNVYFGGINSTVEPEDQPLLVDAITSWVGVDRLAQEGGIGTTLTITVGLATEITGTLDPTPISDLVNAGAAGWHCGGMPLALPVRATCNRRAIALAHFLLFSTPVPPCRPASKSSETPNTRKWSA